MDVRLSPEQHALRDSVARVVDRLGPHAVGELEDAERAAKLDAAVEAAGWRELRTAENGGRPWASAVETAIVAVELSRGLIDSAYIGPTLAAELRRLLGSSLATTRETVVLTGDLQSLGGEVAIDVAGAGVAIGLRGDEVVSFELGPRTNAVDLTRPSASVVGSRTIARLSDEQLARWTALGLALTSADLVGAMRGAIDLTAAYAKERSQYDTLIGSFQAVQHLLADALTFMEGSYSVALHAAWAVDSLPADEAVAAGALAKAYCARAAQSVCETAIQVHGGIGNTWDCLAHVFLRRALFSTDVLGGVGPSLTTLLSHRGIKASSGVL